MFESILLYKMLHHKAFRLLRNTLEEGQHAQICLEASSCSTAAKLRASGSWKAKVRGNVVDGWVQILGAAQVLLEENVLRGLKVDDSASCNARPVRSRSEPLESRSNRRMEDARKGKRRSSCTELSPAKVVRL